MSHKSIPWPVPAPNHPPRLSSFGLVWTGCTGNRPGPVIMRRWRGWGASEAPARFISVRWAEIVFSAEIESGLRCGFYRWRLGEAAEQEVCVCVYMRVGGCDTPSRTLSVAGQLCTWRSIITLIPLLALIGTNQRSEPPACMSSGWNYNKLTKRTDFISVILKRNIETFWEICEPVPQPINHLCAVMPIVAVVLAFWEGVCYLNRPRSSKLNETAIHQSESALTKGVKSIGGGKQMFQGRMFCHGVVTAVSIQGNFFMAWKI